MIKIVEKCKNLVRNHKKNYENDENRPKLRNIFIEKIVKNYRKFCKNLIKTVERCKKIDQKSRKNDENWPKLRQKFVKNRRKFGTKGTQR